MKKITVITPAYNAEKFIKDCILSVGSTVTLGKFEIEHIVVNDNSTDKTLKIINENVYSGLHVYSFDENKGPSCARNFAVEKSDSDYIFFIDSDDVIFQNSLRYLFEIAEENQANWVYGDFLRADKNLEYKIGDDYYGYNFKSSNELLRSMLLNQHFFQQNSLFSRKIFNKVGGFDNEIRRAEDFDLCIKLLLNNEFPRYINSPLYIHRFHETNLSKTQQLDKSIHVQDIKKFYSKYKAEIILKLNKDEIKEIEDFLKAQ